MVDAVFQMMGTAPCLAELRGRSKPKDFGDNLGEGRLANPKPHSLRSMMLSNPHGCQTGDPPTKSRCKFVHSHRVSAHLQSWTAHTPGAGPGRRTPAPSSAGRQLPIQAPKRSGSQLLREGEPGTEMGDLSRQPSSTKSPEQICLLQDTAPMTVQWHHRKTAKPFDTLGLCPAWQSPCAQAERKPPAPMVMCSSWNGDVKEQCQRTRTLQTPDPGGPALRGRPAAARPEHRGPASPRVPKACHEA